MSYMSGLMLGTAIVRGLGSLLSGGPAAGMGFMDMGAGSGMGRGAMGRSSGVGGLFGMMPMGMGSGMNGMFGQGAGRGRRGVEQGTAGSAASPVPAQPAFVLKSAVPGRRRYYASALQGNEELAKLLEKSLVRVAFIDSVETSSVTGSLLVRYTGAEAAADRLMTDLGKRVFGMEPRAAGFSLPQGLSSLLPAAGVAQPLAEVGASLRRTVGAANSWLREKSGGWLDFPSVFALGFIARGMRKVLLYEQRPSGPQMLWWAFSILKGWKML